MGEIINLKSLLLGLIVGILIFYVFGGTPIVIIFLIIWFEKIIIFGTPVLDNVTDFTTISMALVGIIYGPIASIAFGLILFPILEGAKNVMSPFPIDRVPFVPAFPNIIDALTGIIAWLLRGFSLPWIIVILVIFKYTINGAFELMISGKPPPVMTAIATFIFNMFLILTFEDFFLGLIAAA